MKNKKSIIIASIITVAIVAVIVVCLIVFKPATKNMVELTNANGEKVTNAKGEVVTYVEGEDAPTADPWAGIEIVEETTKSDAQKAEDKKNKKENTTDKNGKKVTEKKNKKGKKTDDADEDDGVLYKRDKNGEIVTKKNGEKVTRKEAYPGEADGWSPIVSPDDLEK